MSEKVYITPQGASKLRAELQYLWRDKRPKITRQVAAAAALGDRSENADYIYGKRLLREIDRRVRFLEKRLDVLEVVDRTPKDTEKVFFGAWVRLQLDNGDVMTHRIVGEDEFDLAQGWISLNSPVARALLGKRVGDEVVIERPAGKIFAEVTGVSYKDFLDEQ
ncbi:transcription elongation factor GreB [Pseudomonadales bacterium]|nr:transcription elongation factor GreB [Pseudomonadales bacterium]